MTFISVQFFIFLPAVLLIYFVVPGSWRTSWALFASALFYVIFSPKQAFVLFLAVVLSYMAALLIEKKERSKKCVFVCAAAVILSFLLVFKYTGFVLDNIHRVLGMAGIAEMTLPFSLVMPVGISYFTFQIISYLADVYQGKIRAEKNFRDYALYVVFFPKIISGPIERAEGFLGQIKACRSWKLWNGERVQSGLILMLWGYFQKVLIADRLAIFTGEVFGDYKSVGSVELWLAAAAFYLQLYTDFAGCINIARGVAKIMGFTLMENFNAPLLAKSIREYWARWHISLSTWLRDYVYIPLGGNRKGRVRKYVNLLLTFLVSGFWHGAAWNFVFWGLLHGMYQVAEYVMAPIAERINQKLQTHTESFSYRLLQTVKCWLLVCVGYIFFKVPTATDGFRYLKRMFTKWDPWVLFDGSIYTLGISEKYFHLLLVAIIALLLAEWLKYKKNMELDEWLSEQCIWFRWGVMLILIMSVIIFGAYGSAYDAANFIYFQF